MQFGGARFHRGHDRMFGRCVLVWLRRHRPSELIRAPRLGLAIADVMACWRAAEVTASHSPSAKRRLLQLRGLELIQGGTNPRSLGCAADRLIKRVGTPKVGAGLPSVSFGAVGSGDSFESLSFVLG
jgi:hypothetical protein